MRLSVKPTSAQARRVTIDTRYLCLDATIQPYEGVLYDRAGSPVGEVHACELRDPRQPPTAEAVRIAELKAEVCTSCEHFVGLDREVQGVPAYIVRCHRAKCCGGIRLTTKRCPEGLHDGVT